MKNIQILLSTYNGEKYLREQLDSFVNLVNFENIKVLIRDDGSKDSTRSILKEYEEKYGFEIIIGENIGLNASMYELIKHRDKSCEYFSFSDQDDVWLPEKLSRAVKRLSEFDPKDPVLYASCSSLTDENLNITGHLHIPKKKLTFFNAMIENVCAGHTQVFNKAMMDLLSNRYTQNLVIFDHWVYLLATAVGKVIFDSECTTLYRQHTKNVIGYKASAIGKLKMKIRMVRNNICKKTTKQLIAFKDCCFDDISEKHQKELARFLQRQKNFFSRLAYAFSSKIYRQQTVETPLVKLMYVFKFYKLK